MANTFDNLPKLTDDEVAVVSAMLAPHVNMHDAAQSCAISFGRFLDLFASTAVQAHLENAQKAYDKRLRLRLADAAHKAVDVLEQFAQSPAPHGNPQVAPLQGETLAWQIERRRAATTILRAHQAPRTRRPRRDPRHKELLDALSALAPSTSNAAHEARSNEPATPHEAENTNADSPEAVATITKSIHPTENRATLVETGPAHSLDTPRVQRPP